MILATSQESWVAVLSYVCIINKQEGELVYIEVDPSGVDAWKLEPVLDLLKQGAVGVIPTDTV